MNAKAHITPSPRLSHLTQAGREIHAVNLRGSAVTGTVTVLKFEAPFATALLASSEQPVPSEQLGPGPEALQCSEDTSSDSV